jgi:3-hydroxybutyryl-CoA dehydrogenase
MHMQSTDDDTGKALDLPEHSGVIGGGRMGTGIAHALLLGGSRVSLVEQEEDALPVVRSRVVEAVQRSAARGGLSTTVEEVLARLEVSATTDSVRGAGLVIEAVPEDLQLKGRVLSGVESILAEDAVVATNTSSLSISELAAHLGQPDRVVGLHFFNPVPASLLVEIVVGSATRADVLERATGWVRTLGKTPIVVRDSPGFASSRLGLALGLEAMRMVEEGVASAEDIDAAMALGYKHPMGPLRLTDLVGLDVRLGVAYYLSRTLGPRFTPPAILVDKVAAGELGRKTGCGFYEWTD